MKKLLGVFPKFFFSSLILFNSINKCEKILNDVFYMFTTHWMDVINSMIDTGHKSQGAKQSPGMKQWWAWELKAPPPGRVSERVSADVVTQLGQQKVVRHTTGERILGRGEKHAGQHQQQLHFLPSSSPCLFHSIFLQACGHLGPISPAPRTTPGTMYTLRIFVESTNWKEIWHSMWGFI